MSSGGGAIRTLQCQGSNKLDNVEGDGSEINLKKNHIPNNFVSTELKLVKLNGC